MIRSIAFTNFKSLRNLSVQLEPFTILIGANGSGKSSILEGLLWASIGDRPETLKRPVNPDSMAERPWHEILDDYLSRGSSTKLVLEIIHDRGFARMDFESSKHVNWGLSRSGELPFSNPASTLILKLDPHQLAAPSYRNPNEANLFRIDGSGLASFLVEMALGDPSAYDELRRKIVTIIPTVSDVRIRRVPVYLTERDYSRPRLDASMPFVFKTFTGEEIRLDFVGAKDVPASMVSEGTLIVLGILSVLVGPNRPKLLLLDDLDRGLHPKAQRELIGQLRSIQQLDPELQIVATSHSPYLLDNLGAREVRLTALQADGSTACARLDEHPDFEKWKDEMAPGEFWSLVGESWVAESRARAEA